MANVFETMFIELIIDKDKLNKSVDDSIKKFQNFARDAISILGAIAVASKINQIADQFTNAADASAKFARTLGDNLQKVEAMGEAVIRSGGSIDGFRSSMMALSERIGQAAMGQGEAVETFARLGIASRTANGNLRKSSDVLMQLNRQFQGLSKVQQIQFGKRLGLDEGTIKMLQTAPKELDALIKRQMQLGVLNERQAFLSEKYRDALSDTSQAFRSLAGSLLEFILPAMIRFQEFLQGLAIMMREHKGFFTTVFIAIGAAILKFALPPMLKLALATTVAFLPFIKIAAILTAVGVVIGLIVDDILTFIQGGESLIGKLVSGFKIFFTMLKTTTPMFAIIEGFIKKMVNLFKMMQGMTWGTWEDFIRNMGSIGTVILDNLKGAFNKVKETIQPIINWIIEKWSSMVNIISDKFAPFTKGLENIKNNLSGAGESVKGWLGFGNKNNTTNNTSNSVGVNTINVNVNNGDPDTIANGIYDSLSNPMYSAGMGAR